MLPPVLAGAQEAGAAAAKTTPARGVEITFLANEGFYIECGDEAVLIDAFLRDTIGNYPGLTDEVYKQLVNAQPPFDKRTLVLVSHKHPDHVQMRGLEKYLTKNPRAVLWTSPQVVEALKVEAQDFAAIQERVTAVATVPGVRETRTLDGTSVGFLQFRHANQGSNTELVNLGHLITMGGLKLLHLGDAEADAANFTPYRLAADQLDIVMTPYWFFNSAESGRVLHQELAARTVIACHVPIKLKQRFGESMKASFPDVVLFEQALEKRSFLPREPAEPVR